MDMEDVTPDGANAGQWEISDNHCSQFLDDCRRAVSDPLAFARFRRLPGITRVIETRPWKSVKEIMSHMAEICPPLYDRLRKVAIANDSVGRGHAYSTRVLPTATSAWYARDAAIICWLFADNMPKTVVEIGGGYGGFAAIFTQVVPVDRYAILDIEEAGNLQAMYLQARGIENVDLIRIPPVDKPFDLAIASCSLSELSRETADEYAEKILAPAAMGYVVWSFPGEMKVELAQSKENALTWLQSHIPTKVHDLSEIKNIPSSHQLPLAFYWDRYEDTYPAQ